MDVDGDGDTSDIYDALSLGDYLSALTAGGGGAGGDDGVAVSVWCIESHAVVEVACYIL